MLVGQGEYQFGRYQIEGLMILQGALFNASYSMDTVSLFMVNEINYDDHHHHFITSSCHVCVIAIFTAKDDIRSHHVSL